MYDREKENVAAKLAKEMQQQLRAIMTRITRKAIEKHNGNI